MGSTTKKILDLYFLGFVNRNYSRSSTILNYPMPNTSKTYLQIHSKSREMILDLLRIKKALAPTSVLVVMSPCHKITFLARLLTKQQIVLDAGWPLTDGVLSRGISLSKIPKLVRTFLLDFISFHSAHKILVESHAQSKRIQALFLLPKRRIFRSFTGLNEIAFSKSDDLSSSIVGIKNQIEEMGHSQRVLFRGKINNESGIELIVNAARMLESETAFIFLVGNGDKIENLPTNCIVVSEFTYAEITSLYSLADITLGQISPHKRLSYTIPHKAFEAGFFGKPYISANSKGIYEIFDERSVYFLPKISADELVTAIRTLRSHKIKGKMAKLMHEKYKIFASQAGINTELESVLAQEPQ